MTFEHYLTSAAYAVIFGLTFFFAARPLFAVLQQEGYGGLAMLRWFYRKGNETKQRYAILALCGTLLGLLFALCFSFAGSTAATLIGLIFVLGADLLFLFTMRMTPKVAAKNTPRLVRLSAAFFLVSALVLYGAELACCALGTLHPLALLLLRPLPFALMPLALPGLLALVGGGMKAYEIPHTKKFLRAAKQALDAAPCMKVGITGSFAKTSVKQFAAQLLSEKYRVIATPASFNTPAGIAKCVNEGGLDCDVFLAEMGARRRGDIAELCDMVCPSYAVVTGICPQHLETFGSLEAIRKEKGVLAECAQHVVLGKTCSELFKDGMLLEGRDFGAENIVLGTHGTAFDLLLGGQRFPVKTSVLGRHAPEDLALAAALCGLLGMRPEEIAAGIGRVRPVPHRLQLIEENGVFILDDSYNSNLSGAANAVETLRLFEGGKYVVTPGLVELGELEEEANGALGAQLVGLDVLLVGETRVLAVRRGYLEAGGKEEQIRVVPTLAAAQEILAAELGAGDAVLFLNDLPDKYGK